MTLQRMALDCPNSKLTPVVLAATVVILALPVLFYRFDAREVSSIVEERIAITSREMWRSHEWVVPTLNGEPRLQKPPLAYWLPQLTAIVRGEFDEFTLRLPFAVLAVGSLLFTFGIGHLLLGSAGGLLAAMILLTTPLFIRMGHRAYADGALLFCTLGAWYFHVLTRHRDLLATGHRRHSWSRVAFFVLLGLGTLAKGPVVLALVLLPILIEAAWTRSRDPLRALWSPGGIAIFLLLSFAWPALVIWRLDSAPDASSPVHVWFLESFGKVLPSSGVEDDYVYSKHQKPWYFYLTRIFPVFGVWSLALPLVVYGAVLLVRRRLPGAPSAARATPEWMLSQIPVTWFAVVFLFFSLVSEKKTEYMLPLVPAGAVMIAAGLLIGYPWLRRGLRSVAGIGLALTVAGSFAVFALWVFSRLRELPSCLTGPQLARSLDTVARDHPTGMVFIAGLALVGFLLLWKLSARAEPLLPFLVLSGTMALIVAPYTELQLAWRSPQKMLKEGTLSAVSLVNPAQELYVYGDHMGFLPGGMSYYLDRRIHFLRRECPEKLRDLPAGAALLIPQRCQGDLARHSAEILRSRDLQADGALEGYSFVKAVNPRAREKDKVFLMEKRA